MRLPLRYYQFGRQFVFYQQRLRLSKERKRKTELKTERIKENRKKYKKGRKILTTKEKAQHLMATAKF